MPTATPPAARSHYLQSALFAAQAGRVAVAARPKGLLSAAKVLVTHQATQAIRSQQAVDLMLIEQEIDREAEAILNALAFTTSADSFERMAEDIDTDAQFERLVASLVQDAGRAAESVAVAVRPRVAYVRYLQTPSCSRCAILAGRVYRYSQGFQRHPHCDCVMLPTTVAADDLVQDPAALAAQGLVTGLSKADQRAIADGADPAQVVNLRRTAGLRESGRVLARAGRPTPEAIYRMTSTQDDAIQALIRFGYVR